MAWNGLLGAGLQSRNPKVRRSSRRVMARQPAAPPPRPVNRVAQRRVVRIAQQTARRAPSVKPPKKTARPKARMLPGQNIFFQPIRNPLVVANERAKNKATRALDASYTQPVALKEYRQYVNHLYGKAKGFYPGSTDKPPALDFAEPHQRQLYGAVWTIDPYSKKVIPTAKRTVHLTPEDAWAYVLQGHTPGNVPGAFSRTVPLHEWVHVNQRGPAVVGRNRTLLEGGAEARAQDIARALRLPKSPSNRTYNSYVGYVRRRKGPGYIARGQFKP